ncbi:hypothetical protein AHAS_Ahas17G0031300 [Arachis hypogaea]
MLYEVERNFFYDSRSIGYYLAANYNDPPPAYIYDPWANFRHLRPLPLPRPTKKPPRHGSCHLHPHPHLRSPVHPQSQHI